MDKFHIDQAHLVCKTCSYISLLTSDLDGVLHTLTLTTNLGLV